MPSIKAVTSAVSIIIEKYKNILNLCKTKVSFPLLPQGISIPKRSKRQAETFYSYRRLDAIDINIDCQCVGGPQQQLRRRRRRRRRVVGLVRKRADNFLLSTRHDHVNYVEDWQEMKWKTKSEKIREKKNRTNRRKSQMKTEKAKPRDCKFYIGIHAISIYS